MRSIGITLAASLLFVSLVPSFSRGQWSPDGVRVHSQISYEFRGVMASDGDGGALIFFEDGPGFLDTDVKAVRVDGLGVLSWAQPVEIVVSPFRDAPEAACSDGEGGAFICYMWNSGFSPSPLNVQRLAADGSKIFNEGGGVQVASSAQKAVMIPDGVGGVFVFWTWRVNNQNLFGQRLDPYGNFLWAEGGESIGAAVNDQFVWDAVLLDDGGAAVVWTDFRDMYTTGIAVYVQRVDANGVPQWDPNGVRISAMNPDPVVPRLAVNPLGGIVVVWDDYRRESAGDVFAQYLNLDGSVNWPVDGLEVSRIDGYQRFPQVECFSDGSTFIAWNDDGTATGRGVMMQVVSPEGYVAAADSRGVPNGLTISGELSVRDMVLVPDFSGGVVVSWAGNASGDYEVHSQRYMGVTPQWSPSPVFVSQGPGAATFTSMIPLEDGGVLLSYHESGQGTAQRLDVFGNWGHPAGRVVAVEDVVSDEGGWVKVRCSASRLEAEGGPPAILGYNVWRRVPAAGKSLESIPTTEEFAAGNADGVRIGGAQAKSIGLPEGNWESVGYHGAVGLAEYNLLAPTRTDSTAGGTPWEVFCLTTHTGSPGVMYASTPDSGYSIDNLAPPPPGNLVGNVDHAAGVVQLSWQAPNAQDLTGFHVYRGNSGFFLPDPAHFLGSTEGTEYRDPSPSAEDGYYKVLAYDRHGNLSEAAVLAPNETSAAGTPGFRFSLSQNLPNPFNPSTTISFALPEPMEATLEIFDLHGRRVRSLMRGEFQLKGNHSVVWNGRDDAGRLTASGTYFYHFQAGSFSETKRMMLVK